MEMIGKMTREERKQLDALSKLLTGKSSAWKKAMEQGFVTDMEETLDDGTVRKYRGVQHPTLEEVKAKMDEALKEKLAKEKLEAEKKQKAISEKALDELVAESQRLGLYDEPKTQEQIDSLNEGLKNGTISSVDPVTGQTLDEIRREGTYDKENK